MKKSAFLLSFLLVCSSFMFCQVKKDSIEVINTYPPQSYGNSYDHFSPEESWEIHKAAYIKQLKSKGLTGDEFKRSMITYEKDKEEFIARVKEQHRLAAIQREKDANQRAKDAIQREKDAEERAKHAIQRKKDAEERAKHAIQREKDAEERAKHAIQRKKDAEERAKHAIQREKDAEQRAKDAIKREMAEAQRKKSQEWRNNAENILIENIPLSKKISIKSIPFNVTSKTTLRIGIRAHISSGTTLIEIYNPEGIKEGELSLEHKSKPTSSADNEFLKKTSGALDKTISGAEVGEWQIKISSKKSEGTVAMSVAQYIKPTMDE